MSETQGSTNSNTFEWTSHESLHKLTIHKIGLDSSNYKVLVVKYVLNPNENVKNGQKFDYMLENNTIYVKDTLDYEVQIIPKKLNTKNAIYTYSLPNLIIAQQLQEFLKGHGIQHSGEYLQGKNCMEMDPVKVGDLIGHTMEEYQTLKQKIDIKRNEYDQIINQSTTLHDKLSNWQFEKWYLYAHDFNNEMEKYDSVQAIKSHNLSKDISYYEEQLAASENKILETDKASFRKRWFKISNITFTKYEKIVNDLVTMYDWKIVQEQLYCKNLLYTFRIKAVEHVDNVKQNLFNLQSKCEKAKKQYNEGMNKILEWRESITKKPWIGIAIAWYKEYIESKNDYEEIQEKMQQILGNPEAHNKQPDLLQEEDQVVDNLKSLHLGTTEFKSVKESIQKFYLFITKWIYEDIINELNNFKSEYDLKHNEKEDYTQMLLESRWKRYITSNDQQIVDEIWKILQNKEARCPVCLKTFDKNETSDVVITRPCRHVFCKQCAYAWLKENEQTNRPRTCAFCTKQIKDFIELGKNAAEMQDIWQKAQKNNEPIVLAMSMPYKNSIEIKSAYNASYHLVFE